MEQRESLNRADNDLKGITMRTHRHCQSYRVRIRMKGGQCFDRSFRSKTLAKKWKRDMESAIEHDRYEFTNPATKHTLAESDRALHREGSAWEATECQECSSASDLVEGGTWAFAVSSGKA